MKTSVAICLFVALLAPSIIAQEVPEDVWKKGVSLLGNKVGQITPRAFSAAVTNLCPETRFYMATMKMGPDDAWPELPNMNAPVLFAVTTGKDATSLSSPEGICSFLCSFAKPVADELAAYQRAMVFAELLGGTVRIEIPEEESLLPGFVKQLPENWAVIIAGTKSGYMVSFTLMTDPNIKYCVRYVLNISRDGKTVELVKKETVYTYTGYE